MTRNPTARISTEEGSRAVKVRASAPGKLVVLGEYAVLAGAPALVVAVDRRCEVALEGLDGPFGEIDVRAPSSQVTRFDAAGPSGLALIDTAAQAVTGHGGPGAIRAVLDSGRFFAADGRKLGLGSSAAVLSAFAAALQAYDSKEIIAADVGELIRLHRRLQNGAGSGIDVAAAVCGGLSEFQLDADGNAAVGSVQLPNSVGFAGIFAGQSAKTTDFVGRFEDWRRAEPSRAAPLLADLAETSAAGCNAVRSGDAAGFLAAIDAYGDLLESLGAALRCAVLTNEHRRIAALAQRYAVRYKTSGAGGGDLGIAFSEDAAALAALRDAVAAEGFLYVELGVDGQGLEVEELTE